MSRSVTVGLRVALALGVSGVVLVSIGAGQAAHAARVARNDRSRAFVAIGATSRSSATVIGKRPQRGASTVTATTRTTSFTSFTSTSQTAPVTSASSVPRGQPEWLTVVNLYRATAGLDPVIEDPVASVGAKAHSAYLVQHRTVGHTETVGFDGYSAAGVRAGATGNVASGTGRVADQRLTIEGWMTAPFHALSLLDRAASAYGYGVVGDGKNWASSLSVGWNSYRDPAESAEAANKRVFGQRIAALFRARPELVNKAYRAELRGNLAIIRIEGRRFSVTSTQTPVVKELAVSEPDFATVVWPGDGSAVPLVRYAGVESPDPLTACPGWTSNSGLPLLIHRSRPTEVVSATLTDGNRRGPTLCALTALTYVNPKPQDQVQGRTLLQQGDAILLPKAPLVPGHLYRVQVVLRDGERLDWHFAVSTDGAIKPPIGHVLRGTPTPGTPSQSLG
jgi:uncharacterized protein YkwD